MAGLGAGRNLDVQRVADDGLQLHGAAEHGVDHRDADGAVQVLAVAHEHGVGALIDLDVEVTGGPAAGADLALSRQSDAHAPADAGRDLGGDGATLTHTALPGALATGVGDDLAGAGTGGARATGHDVAQQRPLHGLDLALTLTHTALRRGLVARGALAVAGLAEDGRVDLDLLGHPGGALGQVEGHPDQCVGAGLHAAAGATASAASATAEERLEHVAEASPAESAAASTEAAAVSASAAGVEGVAAHVDDAPLLRIGEDLVDRGDLTEPLTCLVRRVDVGVELAGELAVGALDLGLRGAPIDPEGPVVVT